MYRGGPPLISIMFIKISSIIILMHITDLSCLFFASQIAIKNSKLSKLKFPEWNPGSGQWSYGHMGIVPPPPPPPPPLFKFLDPPLMYQPCTNHCKMLMYNLPSKGRIIRIFLTFFEVVQRPTGYLSHLPFAHSLFLGHCRLISAALGLMHYMG